MGGVEGSNGGWVICEGSNGGWVICEGSNGGWVVLRVRMVGG